MRILILGNTQDKSGGLSYYNTESKLALGLIRNGHLVYLFSAREYAKSHSLFSFKKSRETATDNKFRELARSMKPDLILLTYSCAVSTKALEDYRHHNPGTRIAQICPDILSDPKNVKKLKERSAITDASFLTTAGPILAQFNTAQNRSTYIPNPVDPSIETNRAFDHSDQAFDVFWAARTNVGHYENDPRETFASALRQSGDVRISWYGSGGAAPVFGAAYYDALAQARIGLNINADHLGPNKRAATPDEIYLYSSARIAQLIGSGLLTLSKRDSKLFEIFPDHEMMIFADTPEEALDKVRYFIKHDDERRRIANKAWETYHRDFNSDVIANYIVEFTFNMPFTRSYNWGKPVS